MSEIKDKIMVVFYVGVKNIYDGDVPEYIDEIHRAFSNMNDDSCLFLTVPVKSSSDIRIECINPVLLGNERYTEVEKKVNELNEKMQEAINEFKNNKNNVK